MINDWDLFELDIFREIGTIAAGYGSDAITKMLNRNIKVHLPAIIPLHEKEFLAQNKHNENMLSVQCDILAGLNGKVLLTFEDKKAVRFMEICYPEYKMHESGVFNELGLSGLKEVGNVVVSAYVNALSVFLKSVVVPSPPTLVMGPLNSIIEVAMDAKEKMYVLLIDTVFEKEQEQIKGLMEFMLTSRDKDLLKETCRKTLERNK